MPPHNRRRSERYGRLAEYLAAAVLVLKGYGIVARRLQTTAGEIDLVARRGTTVVIVEVKLRDTHDNGLKAISHHQRDRLQRAAEIYVAQKMPRSEVDIRFDVITVVPWSWPRHLIDAWRPDR